MSQHEVKVVRVTEVRAHGNADSLEVIPIWGYTCCARIGEFKVGDLAAYIEPDTLVPVDRQEFSFLADKARESYNGMARIRAAKLRGVVSMGLLIPALPHWSEGDDVMEELGCKHYDPPVRGMNTGGEDAPAPSGIYAVKYDVESFRKYPDVLEVGEKVQITEKIHGANARFCFTGGELHVSSHTSWKKQNDSNLWWMAAWEYDLRNRLRACPDAVFYGEVYGRVKDLRYGCNGEDRPRLAFFDVLDHGRWLDVEEMHQTFDVLDLPRVPVLYNGPWNTDLVSFAEGPSTVDGADHVREGCVVRPFVGRHDDRIGRVLLKIVGNGYMMRKDKPMPRGGK